MAGRTMNEVEREIYLLHAKLNIYTRKIERTIQIIERGLEIMKSPYISMSFGKDSTVLAHLILSHHPDIPVMYVNCGEYDEWPDFPRVKKEFLALFPDTTFIELRGPSIWEFYKSVGLYIQDEETTPEARRAQREYGKSLGRILDEEARRRGYKGAFIGMRSEESDNRSRLFAMRGEIYFAKTRQMWVCCPLAKWTAQDIWAYIVENDLPYNELYDLAPEGRERARNGAMFGTRSARYGRLVFLKKMYPDWFNRFAAEFPEVRCYI